jgi:RHS repeat-associated protein
VQIALLPLQVWEQEVGAWDVVGARCTGTSATGGLVELKYQLESDPWLGSGYCEYTAKFVERAEERVARIRLTANNGDFDAVRSPTIEIRPYNDIVRTSAIPIGNRQETLQPRQKLVQPIRDRDVVSAKCSGTWAQASSVKLLYQIGSGQWNDRGSCEWSANFAARAERQLATITLQNLSGEFADDRTPFFEVRPYNDVHVSVDGAAVPGPDLYNQLTPMLGPQVHFLLDIANPPNTVFDNCSGAASDGLWLGSSYDNQNWTGQGWCDGNPTGQFDGLTGVVVAVANVYEEFGRERQTLLHVWGAGFDQTRLKDDQVLNPEDCTCQDPPPHPSSDQPVNLRSGNFWTRVTDLEVMQSPGPALALVRTYNSQTITATTTVLGPGWQSPFGARLILPSMPGGEAGRVIVFSGKGNRLRFEDLGNNHDYQAFPGVYSTLVQSNGIYTQTLRDQQQLAFDATTGLLTGMRDAQGRQLTLTYSGTPARLTQIADAADATRFLALTYTASGQIETVSDGTRTVQYQYDANGDLEQVTDVMGRTTSYTYQNHLLTEITNALGQTVEAMTYDAYTPAGKVIQQTLSDGRQLAFTYTSATTTLTTTGEDGRQTITQVDFGTNNAMTGMRVNGVPVLGTTFDQSFSPSRVRDGKGNITWTSYTSKGLPTAVTNALGQTTRFVYDSRNRLTQATNALGISTQYTYNDQNQVIRIEVGIAASSALRATTLYTYTAEGWLLERRSPDGVLTHQAHDSQGQVISTTVGFGTSIGQTTTYGYDQFGRVVTTTVGFATPLARTDVTHYRADNTVEATIRNYVDGIFDLAHPAEDIVTTYGYDGLGRRVWTRDVLGRYAATHYDTAGRIDWTSRNLSPLTLDSQGQPLFQPYNPARPDVNVATLYGFNSLGRTEFVTETGILSGAFNPATLQFTDSTTRVTRTEYDAQSRPVTTTLNYRPGLPPSADTNVQLYTHYDTTGNAIEQIDALGRKTVTQYDALNRPSAVITNNDDGNPLTGPADADLVAVTHYDAAGRVEQQIENYVDGTFTATEPITDRITLYQYDTLSRVVTTTLNYDPSSPSFRTDTNRVSVTAYDPASGRVAGQRDPQGRWASQQYDQLGRVTTTIQNCWNTQGAAVAAGCAPFNPATPDRNVPTLTRYDALDQVYETVDALGVVSHSTLDKLGYPIAATRNYLTGAPTTAITNVTTLAAYGALGQTTTVTDALGYATYTAANGLRQTVVVTDTIGHVTRMGYDGAGMLRWMKRNDGQLTVYQVDDLRRTVASIGNYQDGTVGTNEPSDQDLITRTSYDAAGRRVQSIDSAGRTTAFAYDGLDRLIQVTKNATTGSCAAAPCNVVTQYQYDRAGNRTAIVDARNNVRRFGYDVADQPISATDPLGNVTRWHYNAGGQPTRQVDPRGSDVFVQWSYDDLGQLTRQEDSTGGGIVYITSMPRDVLGRRLELHNSAQHTTFTYDPLGRIISATNQASGLAPSEAVRYGYDANGQRTQLIYPDGTTLDYSYWPDGQLKDVTQGSTTLASYGYDDAGRLHAMTRANETTTTASYDGADRLTDVHTLAGSSTTSRFQYVLDRLGQRMSATETLGSQTRTIGYDYDGLGRLTSAAESPGTTYGYSYDAAGNRTEMHVNTIVTESRDYNTANQVVGWTYDEAGNLTNDGTTTYSYDALNQMTRRGTTNYTYNGDGVLVFDGVTRYTQDLMSPLSQILQTTQGVTTTTYLYGTDRLATVSGGTRTWYQGDALGSVRQTLTDGGTALGSVNYDPWGQVESGSVPMFGFTGELQEATTGLVYLRARWYHAGQGRFTSRDPFGGFDEQPYSQHPYQYAYSNPTLYTDPTGQCAEPGQGDDYCHTDPGGGSDPYAYEKILCVGRGGDWDEENHVCRERYRPPPPNNEEPPLPYPFNDDEKEPGHDTGTRNNAGEEVIGGRRGGNAGVLVEAGLLACYLAMLNALNQVVPTTLTQTRQDSQPSGRYVADTGIFIENVDNDPILRAWIDGKILTDAKITLYFTPAAEKQIRRGQVSVKEEMRMIGFPGGATVIRVPDGDITGLESLAGRGAFDTTDAILVRTAIVLDVPLLTNNKNTMYRQIHGQGSRSPRALAFGAVKLVHPYEIGIR